MKSRKRNFLCATAAVAALAGGLLQTSPAAAHGGVSYEKDMCVMKIETYKMHFTGYQPETAKAAEFCEDIPDEGKAIISLDQVDKAMRTMAVDFRVIKDTKNLGVNAQYEQLGGDKDIEANTHFYRNPAVYEHGSLQIDFSAPKGNYIGVVTLRDPASNQVLLDPNTKKELISVFPFAMGYGPARRTRNTIILGVAGVGIFVGVIYFTAFRKGKKAKATPKEKAAV